VWFTVCLFLNNFVWLRISLARIKQAASNFARWFRGILGWESPILGNFAFPSDELAHGEWMLNRYVWITVSPFHWRYLLFTLTGDGGNDVSMIRAANVGIGIIGKVCTGLFYLINSTVWFIALFIDQCRLLPAFTLQFYFCMAVVKYCGDGDNHSLLCCGNTRSGTDYCGNPAGLGVCRTIVPLDWDYCILPVPRSIHFGSAFVFVLPVIYTSYFWHPESFKSFWHVMSVSD